jgi:hypothetical protein
MPSVGQRLAVVLRPNSPHIAARTRTEPPVSLPMGNAHIPAERATAAPEPEPPGSLC